MSRKVLRKDLVLEACSQEETSHSETHQNGCYIRFKEGKINHSKPRDDCIIDYDESGEIIGIEFYDGLNKYEDRIFLCPNCRKPMLQLGSVYECLDCGTEKVD